MFTMFGCGRCVGWEYTEVVTTTWPRQEHGRPNELKPVRGMHLRKDTQLGLNLASVRDLERIETPHSLCYDFGGYKTFTTRWSGDRIQV